MEPLHKEGGQKIARLNLVRCGHLKRLLEDRVLKIDTLKPLQQRTAEITHHAGIVADDRAGAEIFVNGHADDQSLKNRFFLYSARES